MLLRRASPLLSLLAVATAFKNAAPFLMLSNKALKLQIESSEVQSAQIIEEAVSRYFEDGARDGRNVVTAQPGLTQDDLKSMPKLSALASKWQGRFIVPNVIGGVDPKTVLYSTQDPSHIMTDRMNINLEPELSADAVKRKAQLADLDSRIAFRLQEPPMPSRVTFMLISSSLAKEVGRYAMDESNPGLLKQDLKRDTSLHGQASNSSKSNGTKDNFQDGLPLFERYTYFSPALFMGMSVSILLLLILWVGVSAIAGLEVSYMAFSKEMSQHNEKKQQQ